MYVFRKLQCQLEPYAKATLHIDAAASPQKAIPNLGGQVVMHGDSVTVSRPHHSLFATGISSRSNRVSDPKYFQVGG
jgi:hypothetical protein